MFPLRKKCSCLLITWLDLLKTVDLVTFTEEFLMENFIFVLWYIYLHCLWHTYLLSHNQKMKVTYIYPNFTFLSSSAISSFQKALAQMLCAFQVFRQELFYRRRHKKRHLYCEIHLLYSFVWHILGLCYRYTNADLKIFLHACVHIKAIPWKFCILYPKNSWVICPWSL